MGAQMGILSAPTTGMMFSHPLVGKLTSQNDLVASEEDQLQGALSDLGEAMPQVQTAPTNAQRDLDRAIQQRKQATNARFLAVGRPPPYPEAMPQQAQAGQMGAEAAPGALGPAFVPLVNMPVHGIVAGVPVPRDKYNQRLSVMSYLAALDVEKHRLKGIADLKVQQEQAIGNLHSFGNFSHLKFDPATTKHLENIRDDGLRSGLAVAAYTRIVDLIHAHRADLHAEDQRQASEARQRSSQEFAATQQARKDEQAQKQEVYKLRLGQARDNVADQQKRVDRLQDKIDKLDTIDDAKKIADLETWLTTEQDRLDVYIAERKKLYDEGIKGSPADVVVPQLAPDVVIPQFAPTKPPGGAGQVQTPVPTTPAVSKPALAGKSPLPTWLAGQSKPAAATAPAPVPGGAPAAPQAPAQVRTKQEYDALPVGATYRDEQGNVWRKK
jgi:hypothetical protein